ncbi:MAG: zinc ribbon domain-containing protein [Candidatus Limnocylindria bacterium]
MPDDPEQSPAGDQRPGVPGEAEAAEEFETVPQAASAPNEPQPAAAPPSAVESFETPTTADATAWPPPADAAPAQSVPPTTPVGEGTLCPRCGTENRPGVTFCRQCGQRLVAPGAATVERPAAPEGMQTCPRCGTLNRAGVPFCQNCGANLRPTPAAAAPAYQPQPPYPVPAAGSAARSAPASAQGGAVLGPLVLIIGAVGLAVAWLLPFAYDTGSLYARSFGSADGYQVAFWRELPDVGSRLADQAYFAVAAPVPALVFVLGILAIAGFFRARPGILQVLGLLIAFVWALSLGVLFVVVEVLGANTTEITELLRSLTPAGIIFLLSSLIVLIGLLTRFARS